RDLQGKARQCSVATLLGGTPDPLPVNCLISSETPEEAVEDIVKGIMGIFD
ncbi:MAG: hypothetical protein CFH38_01637, partial [Alphaproteobacteria bacterium MarineAlpha10_Bin1]